MKKRPRSPEAELARRMTPRDLRHIKAFLQTLDQICMVATSAAKTDAEVGAEVRALLAKLGE